LKRIAIAFCIVLLACGFRFFGGGRGGSVRIVRAASSGLTPVTWTNDPYASYLNFIIYGESTNLVDSSTNNWNMWTGDGLMFNPPVGGEPAFLRMADGTYNSILTNRGAFSTNTLMGAVGTDLVTISMEIKLLPKSGTSERHSITTYQLDDQNTRGWAIFNAADTNTLGFRARGSGTALSVDHSYLSASATFTGWDLEDGDWHHLLYSFDRVSSNGSMCYLDGVYVGKPAGFFSAAQSWEYHSGTYGDTLWSLGRYAGLFYGDMAIRRYALYKGIAFTAQDVIDNYASTVTENTEIISSAVTNWNTEDVNFIVVLGQSNARGAPNSRTALSQAEAVSPLWEFDTHEFENLTTSLTYPQHVVEMNGTWGVEVMSGHVIHTNGGKKVIYLNCSLDGRNLAQYWIPSAPTEDWFSYATNWIPQAIDAASEWCMSTGTIKEIWWIGCEGDAASLAFSAAVDENLTNHIVNMRTALAPYADGGDGDNITYVLA